MKRLFVIVFSAALTIFPAEKHTDLPKDLPPYGEMKRLAAPHVTELKLENGLTVWLVPESGFPKVALAVAIRGGYTADPQDRPGFADLIAATVTQGTAKRSAKQIAEEIQGAGGDLSADASADSIVIDTSVLAAKTGSALELIADILQSAAFSVREVEIAKSNATANLKAQEASPDFIGRRALYRALFGNHPYAVTAPTEESIGKTTPEELRREYARRFRPDRTLIVAVGDFSEQSLASSIRASLGAWRSSSEPAPINSEKPAPVVSKTVSYVPRANSVQTTLYFGTLGPTRADGDYAATRVANAIYGGMFGSRLINNIREDKGYTYSPFAMVQAKHSTGLLISRADVRNPVTGASFNEMTYELNRMASTAPEDEEIQRAKRYLLGSLAISLQSRAAGARQLANLWIDSLPPDELGAQGQKIEKVTGPDIQAAGRKYFPAWRMTVVAVGEEQVIKEELAPFGLEFRKVQ